MIERQAGAQTQDSLIHDSSLLTLTLTLRVEYFAYMVRIFIRILHMRMYII